MRHAVHQLHINFMCHAAGFSLGSFGAFRMRSGLINRCILLQRPVNQLVRLADAVRNLTLNHMFSVKTFHWNLRIRRYDNTVRICNFLIRQNIFSSTRASCLNLDPTAGLCRSLFQSLCRHIGMCDTGRAGGNGKDLACSSVLCL